MKYPFILSISNCQILKMKTIFLIVVVLAAFAHFADAEKPKLIFVQSTFRHGARNPFKSMGIGDEYVELQNKKGELTKQGKSMHYLLGKKLRQVYWSKLFGDAPFNSNDFYVRSTDVNRTIESVQSHLIGLLEDEAPLQVTHGEVPFSSPPYIGVYATAGPLFGKNTSNYQPLPIHTMQNYMSACNAAEPLIRFMSYNCPYQNVWQKENLKIPEYAQMLANPKFEYMMKELSKALGKTVNASNFNSFYDSLQSMRYRGIRVPQIFTDGSWIRQLIHLYYSLRQSIIFYGNQDQLRASASDIIGQTIQNMKNAANGTGNAKKWILYSAHDITLGYMMNYLLLSSPQCIYDYSEGYVDQSECVYAFPSYASVLVFELYKYESGKVTFKINYNGNYRKIPFCHYEKECALQELQIHHRLLKVQDVRKLCMTQDKKQIETRLQQLRQAEDKIEEILEKIELELQIEKSFPGEPDECCEL